MDQIEELLTRGVANIIPGKKELEKLLRSGKKLNVYLGIDPTAPRIHLGHAVHLRTLQRLAELGHNVTMLIGDVTALVGDSSDKESERPILTSEEIEENFKTYKKQAEKIVDFSKVSLKYNSEWLKKLSFVEVIHLLQQFSLNDFIGRELIRKRLNEGGHIRLDEAFYSIMQGYDSYHMNTDIQIGATDQTFNMQTGRTLMKNWRNKESFILATEFLMGTDGRKMSKSWGNAIWLEDSAEDIYAKAMAINDDLIIHYYLMGTNAPMTEINEAKAALEKGEHPMTIKKELAFEIVEEVCGLEQAEKAKESFAKRVQNKETPDEMIEIVLKEPTPLLEFLTSNELTSSKSEAKRLIEQGGVSFNEEKVSNPDETIKSGVLRIGKRRFVKITSE